MIWEMTLSGWLRNDIRKRNHFVGQGRSHMFIMIRLIIWIMKPKSVHCCLTIVVLHLLSKQRKAPFIMPSDLNDWYWDGEPKVDNQRLHFSISCGDQENQGMHI